MTTSVLVREKGGAISKLRGKHIKTQAHSGEIHVVSM